MSKVPPEERHRQLVMERFMALKQSVELKKLRAKGLAILGRTALLTAEEWWQSSGERADSEEYRRWQGECSATGERHGLAPWVVEMACLLEGYQPDRQPFVIETHWPRIRIVTGSTDPVFLQWLAYEAHRLGLYIVQQKPDMTEGMYVYPSSLGPPGTPLPASSKPGIYNAFRIKVETPADYPPEAASKLHKEAQRLATELLRRLGYRVPHRLRASPLVRMAEELRTGESQLHSGEIYDIMDEVIGENPAYDDQRKRNLFKSRRHRVRKRLIDQYQPDSETP
jgi:hypothetical protein